MFSLATSPAFVPVVPTSASTFNGKQIVSRSPVRAPLLSKRTRLAAPRMAVDFEPEPQISTEGTFKTLDKNRSAKYKSAYRGPQGFTPYAETINGRAAAMGFVIGLVVEIVTGKTMGQQIMFIFSPVTNIVENVFRSIGA